MATAIAGLSVETAEPRGPARPEPVLFLHGMWGGALISTVLGTEFPGPGTIYISQTLKFSRPVKVGDTVTITLTCTQKFDHNKHILFDCACTNQDGLKVIRGEAEVLAPIEKIKRARIPMPEITISDRDARYRRLFGRAQGLKQMRAALRPMAVPVITRAVMVRLSGAVFGAVSRTVAACVPA